MSRGLHTFGVHLGQGRHVVEDAQQIGLKLLGLVFTRRKSCEPGHMVNLLEGDPWVAHRARGLALPVASRALLVCAARLR